MNVVSSGAPRWSRLVVGVLTAVLLLGVGYAGRIVVELVTAPGDNSAEAGFTRDMSAHHHQAVELAMIAYPKATRPEVRTIAYDIATSQASQIGTMQAWLATWHLSPTGDRPAMAWMPDGGSLLTSDGLMPGMATPAERDQLRAATGRDVDILFCQLMMRHHLGGLHMVDAILKQTSDPRVRRLAESMRIGQTGEVAMMQQLLTDMGATDR
jgi:uncharacterized protein (DUF305 family)